MRFNPVNSDCVYNTQTICQLKRSQVKKKNQKSWGNMSL